MNQFPSHALLDLLAQNASEPHSEPEGEHSNELRLAGAHATVRFVLLTFSFAGHTNRTLREGFIAHTSTLSFFLGTILFVAIAPLHALSFAESAQFFD